MRRLCTKMTIYFTRVYDDFKEKVLSFVSLSVLFCLSFSFLRNKPKKWKQVILKLKFHKQALIPVNYKVEVSFESVSVLSSQATVREDLGELFKKMNHSKYQFMRDRITRLWPYWKLAAKQFEKEKSSFRNRRVKNVSQRRQRKLCIIALQCMRDQMISLRVFHCFVFSQSLHDHKSNILHRRKVQHEQRLVWINIILFSGWQRSASCFHANSPVLNSP